MIEPELLARFEPMSGLRRDERVILAGRTEILRVAAGKTVYSLCDHDGWCFYLLAGRVRLRSLSGETVQVDAGDWRAALVLNDEVSGVRDALALSSVEVIRIPRDTLKGLTASEVRAQPGAIPVADPLGDVVTSWYSGLLAELVEAIREERVDLPLFPAARDRMGALVGNELVDDNELGEIIYHDPVISARLMRVANGDLFGHLPAVASARSAMDRLGRETTRQLVMKYIYMAGNLPLDGFLGRFVEEHWHKAQELASICAVIAPRIGSFDVHLCRQAGLLVGLGSLVLPGFMIQTPGVALSEEDFIVVNEVASTAVGPILAEKWRFDAELATILMHRGAASWPQSEGLIQDLLTVALAIQKAANRSERGLASLVIAESPSLQRLSGGVADAINPTEVYARSCEYMSSVYRVFDC